MHAASRRLFSCVQRRKKSGRRTEAQMGTGKRVAREGRESGVTEQESALGQREYVLDERESRTANNWDRRGAEWLRKRLKWFPSSGESRTRGRPAQEQPKRAGTGDDKEHTTPRHPFPSSLFSNEHQPQMNTNAA
ncbi:hypothetical protein B0H34DRAFT_794290 [Crassisporium funariophilum]|nr:hypothetical protein B0H34DRAFT_794290 [Crassisporium funariophilum]